MDRPKRLRIALADDEADSRRILSRMIRGLGHEVLLAAPDGEALLEAKLAGEVDVVVLDLDMPGLDGLATAEEVSRQHIPVILVSGHPDLESVVLKSEPLLAKLRKPVEVRPLQLALERVRGDWQ